MPTVVSLHFGVRYPVQSGASSPTRQSDTDGRGSAGPCRRRAGLPHTRSTAPPKDSSAKWLTMAAVTASGLAQRLQGLENVKVRTTISRYYMYVISPRPHPPLVRTRIVFTPLPVAPPLLRAVCGTERTLPSVHKQIHATRAHAASCMSYVHTRASLASHVHDRRGARA